jgi:glutathione peroxidase-family protein
MSRITAYAFSFPALAGGDIRLADYAGRPMLVVNTTSLAASPRNMPDCRTCGRSFTREA